MMNNFLDTVKEELESNAGGANTLLTAIAHILQHNSRIDTSKTKDGVSVGSFHLLSDELAQYLLAILPQSIPTASSEEILAVLKQQTKQVLPIQTTNNYEHELLLQYWNTHRDTIKRDAISLDQEYVNLPSIRIKKDTFLSIDQLEQYNLEQLKDVFDRPIKELPGEFGRKELDVPYVTKAGAKKLHSAGVRFLTAEDIKIIDDICSDSRRLITRLALQKDSGTRIGSGSSQKLRSSGSAIWIVDGDDMKILSRDGYVYDDSQDVALPVLVVGTR